MNHALPTQAKTAKLVLADARENSTDSLLYWARTYWESKVAGRAAGTVAAKKNDLQLFFDFFAAVVGTDDVDFWTPLVSRNFKSWLLEKTPEPARKHQGAYAPTSVNRILATLRHFASFIQAKRAQVFAGGFPLEDILDIKLTPPEWNGLSRIELMRLQAALDQVIQLSSRANQNPKLKRSVFSLAVATGLRASEIEGLDFEQYQGSYLKNVRGKGENFRDVYVPAGARADLDAYLASERGSGNGPLYRTRTGGRFRRQYIDSFLKKVAAQANAKLPLEEHIQLHAHKLRHTSIKRVHDKKGPVAAKKHGGHRGFKQLERYATPTREEVEAAADELFP